MRSRSVWVFLFLPLFLLGARAPAGDSLRLRVLVAVYPRTFSDTASGREISNVWREVEEAAAFVRRSSDRRLRLEIVPLVVDRFVPRSEFEEVKPAHYWFNDQARGRRVVENDLLAHGHRPGAYDVVAVFYAFENKPSALNAYGAASIGVDRILGRAAYLAVPMSWGPSSLDEYFEHELLHCLESIFAKAGHQGFPHIHGGRAFRAVHGGSQRDFYAWVLGNLPYRAYLERPGRWGVIERGYHAVSVARARPPTKRRIDRRRR